MCTPQSDKHSNEETEQEHVVEGRQRKKRSDHTEKLSYKEMMEIHEFSSKSKFEENQLYKEAQAQFKD
ncbi:hypothetical protein DFS34DRAFT_646758 [Phlyctochytrium arcticum]|nr:hypothetical protein DFS34DRAFT_646758 [Phlyctochytrium arcticum]